MTQHTPGPWYYHKNINAHNQGLIISETTGANVAVVYNGEDTPVLAASLDLLEALEAIEARINGEWDNPALVKYGPLMTTAEDIINIARAAIAKAKGEG